MKRLGTGRLQIGVLIAVCMLGTVTAHAEELQEQENKIPVYFFHNTACGSCDGTEEFLNEIEDQISYYKDQYPYELQLYNVFKNGGKKEWDQILEVYDLEPENYIFPVMVLDGKMYTGMQAIREQLHEAYLEAAGVSAVYFYRKDCQECTDMEPFWENISETEEYEILWMESRTEENGDLIRQLFEVYEVPDEDQMVPFVFLEDGYLAGKEQIEEKLLDSLKEGQGFGE